jgi:membrane fusion protein (multidrug efflux system)
MKSIQKGRLLLYFAVFISTGLIFTACGEQKSGPPPFVPEVTYITLQSNPVATTTELPGRTSPKLIAEVRPQVGGIIQKRLFTEGADVKAGQPLFQIDPALYQVALENAKAALARSEAQLSTVQLREARFRDLLAEKAISQQDYDDASATLRQIQADIQYGRASVEAAQINLRYTAITAPISGRIGKSNVTEGALVTAHQPLALATIQQLDPMYVDVSQSTAEILRLQRQMGEGQLDSNGKNQKQVKLLLDDGTEYAHKGHLQFRDITVDPSTGSVNLRIIFPNPGGVLMPGMFVRAVVQEGIHTSALLIPQQAVSRDPRGNPLAFIINQEGKVELRPLVLDRAIGAQWLVSSGLSPGNRVIVERNQMIRPDMPVKAVPHEAAKEKSSEASDSAKSEKIK